MLQITKPITVTTTIGALTVTVTPTPSSGYKNVAFSIRVRAVGYVGPAPLHIVIAYGDGTTETKDVSGDNWTFPHTYTSTGTFTITADCKDLQTNAIGSGSASVTVKEELAAIFTSSPSPATGPAPLAVAFTFSMSGGYTPYMWTLDFGNGSTVLSNPTSPQNHTYTVGGQTYTAKLVVTDAMGLSMSWVLEIGAGIIPPECVPWLEAAAALIPLFAVVGVIAIQELKRLGVVQ